MTIIALYQILFQTFVRYPYILMTCYEQMKRKILHCACHFSATGRAYEDKCHKLPTSTTPAGISVSYQGGK